MWSALDDALGRAAARWIDAVRPRARAVVLAFLAAGVAAAVGAGLTLSLNSREDDLFSEDLPFTAQRAEFYAAFPRLVDPLVIVIEAESRDLADAARDRLADRLRAEPDHFVHVFEPGGGPFFEKNGLLYLEVDELHDLVDNLAAAQPYLAELAGDPSLRGLSSILAEAVRAVGSGDFPEADLALILGRIAEGVEAALEERHHSLSWADLILGEQEGEGDPRRFLVLQPVVDFEQVNPAEEALLELRRAIRDLGYTDGGGVRVSVTGLYALSYEEMEHVGRQTNLAGVAAFVLVAGVLTVALRRLRFVVAALLTLLVGLALTAGFAALAIGHLNLISVAFAVLFIGLSIDFAVHLCLRYREMRTRGLPPADALHQAAHRVGGALAICAATTSIGFYAFVPTDYAGVAELGLIAGTGMLISLFANLTLLPALLFLWSAPDTVAQPRLPGWMDRLQSAPIRHARAVVVATTVLAAGATWLCTQLHFDPNPLRMRDPSAPSVQAFNRLLARGEAFPWNVNVLSPDLESAEALAARLEALPQVDMTVTLADYLPDDQDTKLAILEDAALLLGPAIDAEPGAAPPSDSQSAEALGRLRTALGRLDGADVSPAMSDAARRLGSALDRFLAGADGGDLARLEESLVGSLPERLRLLRTSLRAEHIGRDDLPPELVERLVSRDGRVRIEVFPEGDLNDNRALAAYVGAVREVAPRAFGEGVVILESGRAVVQALREALLTASVLIFLLILVLWRSLPAALLVAVPLGLSALFTGAVAVLAGVPLNFANVIVIPLLLGMGVDSAIHLVHRFSEGKPEDQNVLGTSTARAVFYSSLTTISSFGTLGLSTHLGMASLGRLLTIGITMTLVSSLVILPALLVLWGRRSALPASGSR